MSFRRTTAAMLAAATAIVVPAAANAQIQQTSVKIGNIEYTVTEMPAGRSPAHMVELTGPEGTAMVQVNRENKITAYLNPPGGGEYKAQIDELWAAYLKQKNGGASASSTPPAEPADPNAALRAQAAAITAQAQARVNGAASYTSSKEPTVKGPAPGGGVIVHDPNLGGSGGADVTISPDGMKAEWVVDPGRGYPPVKYAAEFEGGAKPASAGAKALKSAKGAGSAVLYSYSPGVVVDVSDNPDRNWKVVDEGSNGKNTIELGGYRLNQIRDSGKTVALQQLEAVKRDVLVAQGYKGTDGNPMVDLSSDRSKRGLDALDEITKAYADPKP
jgi:hypothetical protein